MISTRAFCALVAAALIAGCGHKLPPRKGVVPVTGKMLQANGEPVKRVLIELEPEDPEVGHFAHGATDAEGVIHLSTYSNEDDDGAVPGEYKMKLEPIDNNSTQVNIAGMELVVEDDGLDGIKLKQ
jgi:hypothetical protein